MDKIRPIQFPFVCRCGVRHAKLATARFDSKERLHYDCAACRPRPQSRPRRKAEPGECAYCDAEREADNSFHPPHDPSPHCRSGGKTHCSCNSCF